jgi:putative tricarboxylic transport membrane protein
MSNARGAWRPQREIEIVAGTPAGGGLDRSARALTKVIESQQLLDVPVKVTNVAGDGGRKAWTYLDRYSGDPHVLSISSPNLTTDNLTGKTTFDHDSYTPLATLYNEYIAFVARTGSPLKCGADLIERLGANAASVKFALSTSLGNPNHIALAKVVRHAGGEARALKIRVFDSARDAVGDVMAGSAEVCAVTAASAVPELAAGTMRTLAVSAPERRSGLFERAPTWVEQGIDCVIGAWRGVNGPSALAPEQIAYWDGILLAATSSAEWNAQLAQYYWTRMYRGGADLREYLRRERAQLSAGLAELGMLQ